MMMDIETLQQTLTANLKNKAPQSVAYRKALTIYDSIIESTSNLPNNFLQSIAGNDSNFALFILGSVYKLLIKDDASMNYNIQSMLLLISQTMNHVNVSTIKQSGMLKGLQNKIYELIVSKQSQQKTPLMIRLAILVLSFTLINNDNIEADKESTNILCSIFQMSVQSHRTNVLSKQASKMLSHLVKNNEAFSKVLSRYATMNMLVNFERNLYLNNVREVISEFPIQLINDIGYRVCSKISKIEIEDEADETYLTQAYFFLEKLINKFSTSTLEEICKQLINNVPSSAHSQSKTTFCYLQALHSALQSLISMNQKLANQFVSSVVSILLEFITKGGKIQKQAYGILKSVMGNCIRKSLWIKKGTDDELDNFSFEQINLDDGPRGHQYGKLLCMLKSMLSDEYKNTKGTAAVLTEFFHSLDLTALEETGELIQKIIEFKSNFDDHSFKNLMHGIFGSMSVERICRVYPMSVEGNIADEIFEDRNNLWLAYACQKFQGEQQAFETYLQYFFPILMKTEQLINMQNITNVRKQAYKALKEIFWRCLKVFCRKPNNKSSFQIIIEAIKNQIPNASDSTLDHISQALQSLCMGLAKNGYICNWAQNLISLLAKTLDKDKSNAKQILRAIKYLSKIADKKYLNRVFDKNISKIIDEKQKDVLMKEDHLANNLKNIEILIAVSHGIDFTDSSIVQPFKVSREELVLKLIQMMMPMENLFQKKAYKFIFQIMPIMGSSFLVDIIDFLSAYEHQIMPASKHYRMGILTIIWKNQSATDDNLNQNFQFIKTYLPEIMLNMRQSNQRTRKAASFLFESFCTKLNSLELIQNFIEMICAGLATDSSEMKVATLHTLSEIFTKKYEIELEFSLGILEIVLMLLYEKHSEIFREVINFARKFIFSIQKTTQSKQVLKTILEQFFKVDEASRLEHRSFFKHFLIKLVKKFGRETVQGMIPVNDRKMLTNAIKVQNREKKKKKQLKIKRRAEWEQRKREQEKEIEDDSNDEDRQMDDEGMQIEDGNQLKELQNTDNLLLKYDLDKQNFHFEEQKLSIKEKIRKARKEQKQEGDDITFQEGMMVVKDRKRPRNDKPTNEEEEDQNPVSQAFLNVKKRRKLNQVHMVKESGQSFKSMRAGGDVSTKDKPEPYAFIQFNSKALNKRFKKRAEKAFDSIFQKHEGGLKGIRSKIAARH